MAQNITIQGASYTGVPSVLLPKTGGGTASFVDITATTATASDVAQGKIFFAADGTQTTGTASGGGGGGGSNADPTLPVKLIDYDGTLLYSYTIADFQALSALPTNPSHDGLVAQGWNWTLADAKTQITASGNAGLVIGQTYRPSSGKSEIDIVIPNTARKAPYLGISVNGTALVEWGDGNTSNVTGTSLTTQKRTQHTYAAAGKYTIKISASSGSYAFFGSSSYAGVLNANSSTVAANRIYGNMVKAIRVAENVTIGNYAFYNCMGLKTITFPSSLTSIGTYVFNNDYSVQAFVFPSGFTTIGEYSLSNCFGATSISFPKSYKVINVGSLNAMRNITQFTLPEGVTSIPQYGLQNEEGLAIITLPSTLTTIGSQAFNGCTGMKEYHFKSTTPPTLQSNSLSGIPSDCIIYVPSASVSIYKSASNWSAQSSKITGE